MADIGTTLPPSRRGYPLPSRSDVVVDGQSFDYEAGEMCHADTGFKTSVRSPVQVRVEPSCLRPPVAGTQGVNHVEDNHRQHDMLMHSVQDQLSRRGSRSSERSVRVGCGSSSTTAKAGTSGTSAWKEDDLPLSTPQRIEESQEPGQHSFQWKQIYATFTSGRHTLA